MPNVKISDLTALSGELPAGAVFEVEAGGASYKVTDAQLAEFIRDTMSAALVQGANITLTKDDNGNTITIAAASGGGSGFVLHPGYRSGARYRGGDFNTANTAVTAGALYYAPMIVWRDVLVSGLDLGVVTADTTNPEVLAAICGMGADGRPAGVLAGSQVTFNAGTTSSTSTRYQAFAGGNILIPAGLYFRATLAKGTPTVVCIATNDVTATDILGTDNAGSPLTFSTGWMLAGHGFANGIPSSPPAGITLINTAMPMPALVIA